MSFKDDLRKAIKIATDPNGRCKVSYEEIRKRIKLLKAAQELKQYCKERYCTDCIFSRSDGECIIALGQSEDKLPESWEL